MFNKEYKATNLIDYLDHFLPSCTLCNDTSHWQDGTLCICEGDWREGLDTKVELSKDDFWFVNSYLKVKVNGNLPPGSYEIIQGEYIPFKELPHYFKGKTIDKIWFDELLSKDITYLEKSYSINYFKKEPPKPRDDEKDYVDPLVSKYHFKGCICLQCKEKKDG